MTLCVFNDVWLLTVGNKIRKNKAVLCATAFLTGDGEHNRQPQRQEHPWACETASAFYKFIFHFRGELFWCTDAQITAAQRACVVGKKSRLGKLKKCLLRYPCGSETQQRIWNCVTCTTSCVKIIILKRPSKNLSSSLSQPSVDHRFCPVSDVPAP